MQASATEKRTTRRYETDAEVVCSYLTSNGGQRTFGGTMGNYCARGMYAEMKNPFRKGTILLVKTYRRDASEGHQPVQEGFRSVSLAEVRWSQPVSREGENFYGTGLKYL